LNFTAWISKAVEFHGLDQFAKPLNFTAWTVEFHGLDQSSGALSVVPFMVVLLPHIIGVDINPDYTQKYSMGS